MNTKELTEKIEDCNSKQKVLFLGSYISKNPKVLEHLFELMKAMNKPKHWKAAWVLDHVYQENPLLLEPHLELLINIFKESKSEGVLRITGKLLTLYPVVDMLDGDFINICFDRLTSPDIAVAVKVHAMQLLFEVTKCYTELKPELKMVIEEQIPYNKVAFKSRAKSLLKNL